MKKGDLVKLATNGDQAAYEVLYVTNPNRAVIRWDMGAIVCVDRAADGTWDLSGTPDDQSPEEMQVIKDNMQAVDTTSVAVEKDT